MQIVSREEDSEFVECKECGEIFESSEFKDMNIEDRTQESESEVAFRDGQTATLSQEETGFRGKIHRRRIILEELGIGCGCDHGRIVG